MRDSYLKREHKRLLEENAELKKQLEGLKKIEKDIAALRKEYETAIDGFNQSKKEYDDLITGVISLRNSQRKEFD